MKFRNPQNDHVIEKSAPSLWAFLFGGFYFLVNACWAAMFVWFALAISFIALAGPGAVVIMFVVNIIYAVLAPTIIRDAYLRKGWSKEGEDNSSATPTFKKCPFCAEAIRYEAIKCKHCGSDLPSVEPAVIRRIRTSGQATHADPIMSPVASPPDVCQDRSGAARIEPPKGMFVRAVIFFVVISAAVIVVAAYTENWYRAPGDGQGTQPTAPSSHQEQKSATISNSTDRAQPTPHATASGEQFIIQVVAVSDAQKAKQMQQQVLAAGIKSYIDLVKTARGDVSRVRAGPFGTREEAERAQRQLRDIGFDGKVIPK